MKMLTIASAALVAALALPAGAAQAQHHSRTVVGHTERHVERHHGRHATWKNVCRTTWRHHHKVRTCHRVRSWR